MIARFVLTLAAFLAAGPAAAHQGPAPNVAPRPAARAANLDAIVAFFVPAQLFSELMIDGTITAYRTRNAGNESYRELEAACHGILEAMAAAGAETVRAAVPGEIARLQDEARNHWNARLSDADAAAMGAFASHPSITVASGDPIDFQPGDTASAGVRRNLEALDRTRIFERFDRHQAAFALTPAGRRLLPIIAAYQTSFQERMNASTRAMVSQFLAAAHRAANDFVGRRCPGLGPPYRDP